LADPAHPVEVGQFEVPISTPNDVRFDAGTLHVTGLADRADIAAASWDITDPAHLVQQATFGAD